MTRIGRERGWPAMTRAGFDQMTGPTGAVLVGDPDQVAEKILYEHQVFNNDRFLAQVTVGTTPHMAVMRAIELLGTRVAPVVKAEVIRRTAT
jgi:alkanesulfonate monooxygenase SsuD/methylene tetrahydromethanopterin reductase-like flavin-dependent oxidoreductase (luciferase family)